MQLSCTKENLNKGLNIVSRAVSARAQLPILNNILLTTEKGGLKIAATDLEIGISTWIGAKIENEGAITIPSRMLLDFVSNNNDEIINLKTKNETLCLSSKKFQAELNGIKAEEFPKIPNLLKNNSIEFSALELKQAINLVNFACAFDDTRPVLNGVLFKFENQKIKLAATDSYRLAEKILLTDKPIKEKKELIIPNRGLNEVARIISEDDEKVEIYFSDNQAMFKISETQIVTRLIEGSFPDYEQIIPKSNNLEIIVATNEFASALKMASLFARENANNIKLKIKEPNSIEIHAASPQLGSEVSKIEGEVKGKELEIAFNAKYLLDVLNNLNFEKIIFSLSDRFAPGAIKGIGDQSYLYIIMPLRIDE